MSNTSVTCLKMLIQHFYIYGRFFEKTLPEGIVVTGGLLEKGVSGIFNADS